MSVYLPHRSFPPLWSLLFNDPKVAETVSSACCSDLQQPLQSEHDLRSMDSCRASMAAYGQGKNACHFTER